MKKIELKAKQFAKKYIENNYNGTETAMQVYNAKNRNVAHNIASENLQKPTFQKAIQEALEDSISTKDRISLVERNAKQSHTLPASNTALDMMFKIMGDYAPDKSERITITLTGAEALVRLREIDEEIRALNT